MEASVVALLELMELQSQGEGVFVGPPAQDGRSRVFGGQLLGQALAAASLTTEPDWLCHSLHAYFLRPGKPGRPIDYEVSSMRDGRRMATRKVVGLQRDEVTFELTASFERDIPGPEHQAPMLDVPPPESSPPEAERMAQLRAMASPEQLRQLERTLPIEFIWPEIQGWKPPTDASATFCSWMRVRDRLPDDPNLHQVLLAYASDMGALKPALTSVGYSTTDETLLLASLDHALWFHRPFRIDEWLLFTFSSVSVSSGRGLSRGVVHTRDGRHVASLTQEAIMRPRDASEE
ncbi:MAG: acyl-CoA thioesterase domain-containing protein [Polyangiales bacterium]